MRAYIIMRDENAVPTTEPRSTQRDHGSYVIASALRTLHVLRAFSGPPHRLGLAQITEQLGMERNQAYRSLKTLEAAGFLRQSEDAKFELGPAASELATGATLFEGTSLLEVAAPFLDGLRDDSSESVHLFVRLGDRAVCIDKRESPQTVRLVSILGRSLPLHAGAVPKAMLAALPEDERERIIARLPELPRYTEKTVLTPQLLREQLREITAQGYSVSDEDFDASARGVGAAIIAGDGSVAGGISVGGPSFRVTEEKLAHFAQLVREAAVQISRRLALTGHD